MILNAGTGITTTESPNDVFTFDVQGGGGGGVSDPLIVGDAEMGTFGSGAGAVFCHKGNTSISGFALKQNIAGLTILNSKADLLFRINNNSTN